MLTHIPHSGNPNSVGGLHTETAFPQRTDPWITIRACMLGRDQKPGSNHWLGHSFRKSDSFWFIHSFRMNSNSSPRVSPASVIASMVSAFTSSLPVTSSILVPETLKFATVDASNTGIGMILSQQHGTPAKLYPCAFSSWNWLQLSVIMMWTTETFWQLSRNGGIGWKQPDTHSWS